MASNTVDATSAGLRIKLSQLGSQFLNGEQELDADIDERSSCALQGITHLPVFTRAMETVEQVALPGRLPQDAYLGERPRLLRDYRDDTVARDVRLPAVQRMIPIQGNELSPGG